jgi:hypothetical protein
LCSRIAARRSARSFGAASASGEKASSFSAVPPHGRSPREITSATGTPSRCARYIPIVTQRTTRPSPTSIATRCTGDCRIGPAMLMPAMMSASPTPPNAEWRVL